MNIFGIGFSKNQLKIIAAGSMCIDHIGITFFPNHLLLRVIGRIAFPIFAYSIYEGCRYTHHKFKYFMQVFLVGLLCMAGYYVFSKAIYGNVMITFSLSLLLLYSIHFIETAIARKNVEKLFLAIVYLTASSGLIIFLLNVIYIDYGIWGILIPVFADLTRIFTERVRGLSEISKKWIILAGFALGLLLLSIDYGGIQFFGIVSIVFLVFSTSKLGKRWMKYFFYGFYPIHLVLIEAFALML